MFMVFTQWVAVYRVHYHALFGLGWLDVHHFTAISSSAKLSLPAITTPLTPILTPLSANLTVSAVQWLPCFI